MLDVVRLAVLKGYSTFSPNLVTYRESNQKVPSIMSRATMYTNQIQCKNIRTWGVPRTRNILIGNRTCIENSIVYNGL